MSEISELERRINAALDRIARAAEAGAGPDGRASAARALREALEAERTTNAQLTERVRAIKDKQETMVSQIERKLGRATEQLDVQGIELQRLRRANTQLADSNRRLIAAQEAGRSDGNSAIKALQAELESLRAARRSEMVELEEIMGELRPLVGESAHG